MGIKKVADGWRIDFHRRNMPRVRQTFTSRTLAQAVLDQLVTNAIKRKFGLALDSGVTIAELVERRCTEMRARGRDKSNTNRAEVTLNRFANLVGGKTLVEKIKRADLRRYAELRDDGKRQPQSVNREITEIKSCLSKATIYYEALEEWQPPKGVWLEKPTDGRRQTWSDEEIALVLAELYAPKRPREQVWQADGRYRVGDMFRVALATGMRAGEVRNLRKPQLDFRNRVILVTSKKGMTATRSARTREVPMTDEVFNLLKRRADEAKGEYLFCGKSADEPMATHVPAFKKACKRAGISYGYDGLIFNDARRTAENRILEAGHSARAVGDIFGHSAETMARHYARSTREQRRRAVESTGIQARAKGVDDFNGSVDGEGKPLIN